MRLLCISAALVFTFVQCVGYNLAVTADDVNSGSILGSIVRDPRSPDDTVTVCLYRSDTVEGLSKRHSGHKAPLKTVKTVEGSYRFDSLSEGVYWIHVINDSIIVGKKDDIRLESGQIAKVDIVVVIVINVKFSIQSDQNITVNDISIDNGKINKLEGGYVLTIAGVDTQSFEITFDQNGKTSTTKVQIVLQNNVTAIFEHRAGPVDVNIMPSYESDCIVPGAIACFSFNNGKADDASGNGNHGRIVGATPTADRFGNPNSALLFDGNDDYVIVEELRGTIPGNTPKTVSGWFNSSKPNKYLQMLFGFGTYSTPNNFQIGVGPTTSMDDQYQFRVNGWGDRYDWRTGIPSGEYFDGKWHHCAVTYDGTTTKVYFDGALAASTEQFKYVTPEASSLVIGREIDLVEWEFDGALDDIKVFARAINESEVATLFGNTPIQPKEPNCVIPYVVACLCFSNGSGEDASGNGNHGTIVGASPTSDRFGNPRSALLFDGKDDYVIVKDFKGIEVGNTPKSISGWFNSSKPNKYLQMLFGFGAPTTPNNFQIGVGPTTSMDDQYQFRVNGWGDCYDWRTGIPSSDYFDGKWHLCVVTYDGETTKVYFDGVLSAQTSQFAYETLESPTLVIGREIDLVEWEFEGALDDIRIFNWAINEYAIAELYNEK
jgi:hypothetical protein